MNDLYPVAQWLWQFNWIFSTQLLLILALRGPLLSWVGPLPTYRLWLLPLCVFPFLWLEHIGFYRVILSGRFDSLSSVSLDVVGGHLVQTFSTPLVSNGLGNLAVEQKASFPWLSLAMGLWAFVTIALTVLLFAGMYRFAQRIRTTSHVPAPDYMAQLPLDEVFGHKLGVRLVDDINSPALFGAFRPVLLLPVDFLQRYNTGQQRLILAHEAVHLRRRDNLLNLLLSVLRLTFWWNPLIHTAWRRYRMDQELSCDAQALALSTSHQQLYARALLKTLPEGRMDLSLQPTLSTWNQVRELKERTRMIGLNKFHRTRRGLGALILSACLLLGAASTLLAVELISVAQPEAAELPGAELPAAELPGAELPAAELPAPALVRDNGHEMQDGLDEKMEKIVEPHETDTINQDQGVVEADQRGPDVPGFAQENYSPLLVQLNNERDLAPESDNIESLQRSDAAAADILHSSNSADSQNEQAQPNLNPISIVEPEYPRRAQMRGIEGYALVEFTVTATGSVEDVKVFSSQPKRTFDRSAISAASQFRFDPFLQDGEAVAVEGVRYRFNYKIGE